MKVMITGASGFVASHVIPALADKELVLVSRSPQKLSGYGFRVLKFDYESLGDLVLAEKPDVVVNLIGILDEREGSFEDVHFNVVRKLVDASAAFGCKLFVQMSALGCYGESPSRYKRTKAMADDYIKRSGVAHVILKPSIIMGKGQRLFSDLKKVSKFVPVFAVPRFKVQPIHVDDVSEFVKKVIDGNIRGEFELCGEKVVTMRELFEHVLRCIGVRRSVIEVPKWTLKPIAYLGVGMTIDQYRMLDVDNVCLSNDALKILGSLRDAMVCGE